MELELGTDMASLNNLLGFLEKVFNGGSDFNEPITRCLDRMTDAKWANSDILLVSDGELRQPGQAVCSSTAAALELWSHFVFRCKQGAVSIHVTCKLVKLDWLSGSAT